MSHTSRFLIPFPTQPVDHALGAYFGVNPWLFRLLFIFLLLPGGLPGLLPYVVLWAAIPRQQL